MTTKHYVDNKKLLDELTLHRQNTQEAKFKGLKKPRLSNFIGECIMLIAKNLSNRPNFINYPFKEEMIGDGIENCLRYIDNFDPEKSKNPFSYITKIIYFAFLRRITFEKKELYTKHKLIQKSFIDEDMVEQSEWNEVRSYSVIVNEHMNDFVRSYEDTMKKKKKKKTDPEDIEQLIEEDIQLLEQELVIHD